MLRPMIAGLVCLLAATAAVAQSLPKVGAFPDKPIRFISPFPPGGGADILARAIAPDLNEYLRVQVIVDNRAGRHDGHLARSFVETACNAGRGESQTVWRVRSPDDVFIAVSGGAGPQDLYIAAGAPKIRLIHGG